MANIKGCNLPDDLYYYTDKHIWVKPLDDGNIRVGMSTVAVKLSGGSLIAVTVKQKKIGSEINQGKSVATLESSKFVGPVPAPVTGTLAKANEKVASNPNIVVEDPYGEGWIVEMTPADWDGDKGSLAFGEEGLANYKEKLEAEGISCE